MPASYLVLQYEESPRYEDAPATTPTRVSTVKHYLPLLSGRVAAEPQFRSRDDELRGNLSPTSPIIESYAPAGAVTVGGYVNSAIPLVGMAGFTLAFTEGDGANEVQSLTESGTISGGTFDLTVTANLIITAIPAASTAAQLQALIDNRIRRGGSGFKLGDIVVAGGPVGTTPFTLTFEGTKSCTNVAAVTVNTTNLTGSTPDIIVATDTAGTVGTVTLPDGSGLPPNAYRCVATKSASATPQSAQLIAVYAENAFYEKGQGYAVSQLAMGDDGNWAATMTGLVSLPADDPGLTPSYDSLDVWPLLSRDLIVTWRAGSGNIAGLTMQIDNPFVALRNFGARSAYPGVLRFTEGFVTATGTVTMDSIDEDDRTAHYEGDVFAMLAHWKSTRKIGSTGALYQMFVDAPSCQITGGTGPEELAAKRNFGASYTWGAFYDEGEAKDVEITFATPLTTAATYA
jgi:hypothetical protein